jgi:uncharacterized membrane protein HdeD (DUF308 family)/alpha-beta hydrolase superfamily lysophospholipase
VTRRDRRWPSTGRFYRRLFERFPWQLALVLGVGAVLIGLAITFKPFNSLGVLVVLVAVALVVTGISEIASARTSLARWGGVAWIAAGVVVVAWPGLSIRALAIFVGVSLLIGGVLRIASAARGDTDDRLVAGISGLAHAIFGALALSWPDITLLVVALLVGPAMILFGLGQAASALRDRGATGTARKSGQGRGPWPAWVRLVGVSASLVFALGLLAISWRIHRASSSPDAFYNAPETVPAQPGALLRSEPFTRGVPDSARARRILYTTTRDDTTPALASGIVLVSKTAPAGPRPVIAWAHGTTGFASRCAPSLLSDPFRAGALPALDELIANGWVLVATDYVGLGTAGPHPYLIGDPTARSVLDSVRAARQLDGLQLEPRTVVWGHSQGGDAALWTGMLAPRYAPDANVIGVAALAPAAELPPLVEAIKDTPVGKIMGSYVLAAYSASYPDVRINDYVRPAARVHARETAGRCLSGPEALVSVGTAITIAAGDEPYFSQSPSVGALGARLKENIPLGAIVAPLLIGQGLADGLVRPAEQERYVARLCASGQALQYRTYEGFDHVGLVLDPASPLVPDLLAWTQDRLDGRPQGSGCQTVRR